MNTTQKADIFVGSLNKLSRIRSSADWLLACTHVNSILKRLNISAGHPEYHLYHAAAVDVVMERDYPKDAEL